MADAAAKLALEKVASGYGAIDIITELSLAVQAGEIFALMGKNGMGKTTLLKTILGLIRLRAGAITVDGRSIAGASPASLIASGIAYGPQEQALFQDLSIRDNLRLALRSDRELDDGLDHVYGYFPFMKETRPEGRHAVGRRAEDADPRPRAHAQAEAPTAR